MFTQTKFHNQIAVGNVRPLLWHAIPLTVLWIVTLAIQFAFKQSGNWYLTHTATRFVSVFGIIAGIVLAFRRPLKSLAHSRPKIVAVIGVFLPSLLLNATANPLAVTGDTLPVLATCVRMMHHGARDLQSWCGTPQHPRWQAFDTDGAYFVRHVPGRDGLYSSYPAGMEAFALPAVMIAECCGANVEDDNALSRVERLTAAVIAALGLVLFFQIAKARTDALTGWVMSMLLATGSVFTSTLGLSLWQQSGVVFWMLVALRFEVPAAQGLALAMMTACRPSALLFALPFFAAIAWTDRIRALKVALFATACYAPWATLYSSIYGTLLGPSMTMLKDDWALATHLGGVLISPSRGLFVYQIWLLPLLVRRLQVLFLMSRGHILQLQNRQAAMTIALVAFTVLHLILVASWPCWWGGHCHGSRLAAEVVPILALLLLPALQSLMHWRGAFASIVVLAFIGLAIHLPGSHGTAQAWNFRPVEVNAFPERLWDWRSPPFLYDVHAR